MSNESARNTRKMATDESLDTRPLPPASPQARPLRVIAEDILDHWTRDSMSREWSMPYIRAMRRLDKLTDKYGHDAGDDIVIRFLVNAKGWRGPDAKRIKDELKAMLVEAGK